MIGTRISIDQGEQFSLSIDEVLLLVLVFRTVGCHTVLYTVPGILSTLMMIIRVSHT